MPAYLGRMDDVRTLRLARLDDMAAVDRLLQRSFGRLLWPDYPPSVMVTVVPLLARAQPGLLVSGRYFVVEGAGRLLAAGGYSLRRQGAEIRHVAVDPDVARQGVGRLLMAGIFQAAEAEGVRRYLSLSTLTAVPFYAALGFRATGRMQMQVVAGIGFDVMRMQRDI